MPQSFGGAGLLKKHHFVVRKITNSACFQMIIQTDASKTGWGANVSKTGVWDSTEKLQHINILEFKAVNLVLLSLLKGQKHGGREGGHDKDSKGKLDFFY